MPRPGPARSWIFKTELAAVSWRPLARGLQCGGGVSLKLCFLVVFNMESEPGVPGPPKQNKRSERRRWQAARRGWCCLRPWRDVQVTEQGAPFAPAVPGGREGGRQPAPSGPAGPPPSSPAVCQAAVGCGGFGRAVCVALVYRIQTARASCVPFLAHVPRGWKKLNGRSRHILAAVGAFGSERELFATLFSKRRFGECVGPGGGRRHLERQLDRDLRDTCRARGQRAAVLAGVCPVGQGGRAATRTGFPKPRPRAP